MGPSARTSDPVGRRRFDAGGGLAPGPSLAHDVETVSLRRRLYNVARTEAAVAATRLRAAAGGLLSFSRPGPAEAGLDAEYARIRAEVEAEFGPKGFAASPSFGPGLSAAADSPEVRRFYANLELPIGAPLDEVKAAYRRLMRRYHPDKHHADPERAAAANRLAHELRAAYEGLLRHLSR